MAVGLLVLFTLIQLFLIAGQSFFPELISGNSWSWKDQTFSSLTLKSQESGARILQKGEEKAREELTPLLEERVNKLLRTASGRDDLQATLIKVEGGISGVRIVYDPGREGPGESLQRLIGEVLGIDPKAVEVEKAIETSRTRSD